MIRGVVVPTPHPPRGRGGWEVDAPRTKKNTSTEAELRLSQCGAAISYQGQVFHPYGTYTGNIGEQKEKTKQTKQNKSANILLFCNVWHLEGSMRVQNTPRGVRSYC